MNPAASPGALLKYPQTEENLQDYTLRISEWRGCLMLLPLVLFALVSAATARTGIALPGSFAFNVMSVTMALLFCVIASRFIPSRNSSLQIVCVIVSFCALVGFDLTKYPTDFQFLTVCISSALSSTLVFLPYNDIQDNNQEDTFRLCVYGLILPAAVHFLIMTIVRELDSFITLTFTSDFVTSFLAVAVVPCFTLMQTMGVSGLINAVESLQYPDLHILAIPGAITLTNLISLPAVIIASSFEYHGGKRVFLTLFGCLAAISANSGPCVSAELMVLLIFFPGTYACLLLSSVFVYMCALTTRASVITNFYLLYQPNLTLLKTTGFSFNSADLICIAVAAVLPPLFFLFSSVFLRHRARSLSRNRRSISRDLNVGMRSRPDLIALAILKACGGLSNLSGVNRQGRELLLDTRRIDLVSELSLSRVCARHPRYDRLRGYMVCDLGANCALVSERLRALLRSCGLPPGGRLHMSQDFSIRDYLIAKHQNSKGERDDSRSSK